MCNIYKFTISESVYMILAKSRFTPASKIRIVAEGVGIDGISVMGITVSCKKSVFLSSDIDDWLLNKCDLCYMTPLSVAL